MPVPKKRTTRAARDQRRSHHALKPRMLTFCPQCKESLLPHRVCLKCGTYSSRQVLVINEKKKKKSKKEKEQKKK